MTKFIKNILIITAGIISFTAISSCKKYLDQRPITDLSSDMVFSDVPNTYKALAGVYSRLVGDNGYGIRVSLYFPLDNDEMQGPTGAADNDRRDIARFAATPGNAQIEKPFNQMFQGIEYANICIDNIPKMSLYKNGTDQEKKKLQRMYGEALTLRAQFYYEAIRNWGDLPAHFEPAYAIANANPFPAKVDRDTLYNRLLNDLSLAATLVPWRKDLASIGDASDERITKGTVKALRARIALARGGYSLRSNGSMMRSSDYAIFYQMAKTECSEIMASGQHALNPSFRALWKDQVNAHAVADPEGELMFQASAIGYTSAEDTKLGYYNGPTVNGLGNKSVNVLPTYLYLFDSTDTRRDVTCAPYIVQADGIKKTPQTITAINDGKYRRDWVTNPTIALTSNVQYLGLKWQIIRYSDVLLMFAEAENELNGPTAAAYDAINQVRRRGYAKPIATPDATVDLQAGLAKDAFFAAIVKERSLELGGEGIRKYDLIRWNLLAKAIAESKANLLKMGSSTAMTDPTYMAGYPSYSKSVNLPTSLYFIANTPSDVSTLGGLFVTSLYAKAPSATPTGSTKLTWLSSAITAAGTSSPYGRFATGFVSGKSELLPLPQAARDANINLTQNPGY